MSGDWRDKLDARGRRLTAAAAGGPGALDLLLLTAAPPTPAQLDELARAGMHAHSSAGNVLTGTVDGVASLRQVAELPFVSRIELSRQTHPE
ncbi:hypothetical protein MF672_036675 [Actinomadura sp. ATCC 31491]|uniref:Uncharacterized protein n=1 Tax=Actinomadura luzonensis TaxID=2805427 RepID=A0ABT0G3X7_9ACTN|nr:hypothetical protein [Actinomadura luzonensis]MCK2219291.1 hypothetical protein [Actinomadura luzonensis]